MPQPPSPPCPPLIHAQPALRVQCWGRCAVRRRERCAWRVAKSSDILCRNSDVCCRNGIDFAIRIGISEGGGEAGRHRPDPLQNWFHFRQNFLIGLKVLQVKELLAVIMMRSRIRRSKVFPCCSIRLFYCPVPRRAGKWTTSCPSCF